MRRSNSLQRLLILGLSGPIVALNFWLLYSIFHYFERAITVLAIAAILAFLLNYPVQFFERARITRTQAVLLVLLTTVALCVIIGVTVVPVAISQTTQFLNGIPGWLEAGQKNLLRFDLWAKAHHLPLALTGLSSQINTRIAGSVQLLAGQAVGFALGTLNGLLDLVLVVVLAFYMLLYGASVWRGLINLLPPHIGIPLSVSLHLNFQNFFISQLLLGLFMIVTLTPIFIFFNVTFPLLFALLIGMGELIPFVGATLGISLVTLLVLIQSWRLALLVAAASVVMQQIKDNLVAPRLMSNFIGLNPIWIFIALLMGAEIAGFLGVVVAVPIAGTIKGTIEAIQMSKQGQGR
ncbi:MAG: AI-2E family transporter [Chroococcidiopsidaceae cyanobacterium CP_BM_ER_R8_30]|nr:AI-2E family transporter [Chroococcidiopsidaceae cyanobacterium CP_BM_ER_R8_30]